MVLTVDIVEEIIKHLGNTMKKYGVPNKWINITLAGETSELICDKKIQQYFEKALNFAK